MMYELKDKKDKDFNMVGTLENILEFLNYADDLSIGDARYQLNNDSEYQNDYVSYYIKETNVHIADREGRLCADVYDIIEGMDVINWFECQDGEEYEPGYYRIVDDDGVVLTNY